MILGGTTLVLVLCLAVPLQASADETEAPLRALATLFDTSDTASLGLGTIPAEHTEIYHATEESGFRFSHHPGLAAFKGTLYCSWSNAPRHEDRPGQRVLYASSRDGRIWSPPRTLAVPDHDRDSLVAAGFYVAGDALVAYYTARHDYPIHNLHNPKNALHARTSSDGEGWSEPRKVATGFFIEAPRRLPNGRLLLAGEHAGEQWKTNQARMRLLYSDETDGITGWNEAHIDPHRVQPNGTKVFGYTEPCPFVRKDGAVVATFRNGSGYLYASLSRDNGATWSVPQQTNFPDTCARASTGHLPDGSVFLINNPGPRLWDRSKLTIALSDDGVTFDRVWIIRSEPTTQRFTGADKLDGWQYPHATVWQNHLYVAYSVNKEDIVVTRIAMDDLTERTAATN
ncbi:MAG: hypothetical protein GY851_24875 [bacterium]|nr:hypothetical protein [bacterium]